MTDTKTDTNPSSSEEQGFLPSPRLSSQLYGQEQAEQAFLRAWQSGSLPHAWALQGTRGVGKATFAYRAARALLSRHSAPSNEDVATTLAAASSPSSAIFQQVKSGTHPDFALLASEGEKEITIAQSRELVRFLYKTPVVSRYRVGIVDSADRLTFEAASALLKIVEEPGRRVVLLLVCHASEALLPTLRSRCRALLFPALGDETIADFLRKRGAPQATARRIAALSCGSMYYAGLLADADSEGFLDAFGKALSARLTENRDKSARKHAATFLDQLGEKAFLDKRAEAFRFLWQRFLSCAVRANAAAGRKQGEKAEGGSEEFAERFSEVFSGEKAMLDLLSQPAREAVERRGATFWQGLWQRSVPHLLASRAARGGDFALSANYALEGLTEAC